MAALFKSRGMDLKDMARKQPDLLLQAPGTLRTKLDAIPGTLCSGGPAFACYLFSAQNIDVVLLLTLAALYIPQRHLISPLGGLGKSSRAAHSYCGAQPQALVRGSRCVLRACLPLEPIIPAASFTIARSMSIPSAPPPPSFLPAAPSEAV